MKRWIVAIAAASVAGAVVFAWLRRPPDPEPFGLERVDIAFESELVDRDVEQIAIVRSSDDPPREVVVLLHGRGSSPEEMLSEEMFAALQDLGAEAPAVLLVDGGQSSYFHDRDDGEWATYVVEEAIPEASDALDTDFDRIAVGGISMGGFGALNLARQYPGRWCGIGAHSPALFDSFDESAEGAFDDVDDFGRHDLLAAVDDEPEAFTDVPIRIDVGSQDPFAAADRAVAEALEEIGAVVLFVEKPGAHDEDYWWSRMPAYFDFYAAALARC